MEKMDLVPGDVVQISPEITHSHIGMLCVVTEPKSWGCQGYLMHWDAFDAVRVKNTGKAYVRLRFESIEYVGRLPWIHEDTKEKDEE